MRIVRADWMPRAMTGNRPGAVVLDVARAARAHRTTGHAAEMAFFAVLTLVPSTVAVGSALGAFRTVIGDDAVRSAEDAAIEAVRVIMGPNLADEVIGPFVHAQLAQPRGGVALGFLLVAWWLASHLFASTGHALDTAYDVTDCRRTVSSRLWALGFALFSVGLVSMTVEVVAVGPLGDPNSGPAADLGMGHVYAVLWSAVRWPLLLAVIVAFLVMLYRYSPSVRNAWADCVPGAIVGAVLWILAAVAFRASAGLGLRSATGVAADDPAVNIIGQSVNAVVATTLWAYLASIAILLGGELNAALQVRRDRAVASALERPDEEALEVRGDRAGDGVSVG